MYACNNAINGLIFTRAQHRSNDLNCNFFGFAAALQPIGQRKGVCVCVGDGGADVYLLKNANAPQTNIDLE